MKDQIIAGIIAGAPIVCLAIAIIDLIINSSKGE